jgi:hypothetical protein
MSTDLVPASAVVAVQAVAQVGGFREISALATVLDSMTIEQIVALGEILPAILKEEISYAPHLQPVRLTTSSVLYARNEGRVDFHMKLGELRCQSIYHRALSYDLCQISEIKFDPFSDRMLTIETKYYDGVTRSETCGPHGAISSVVRSKDDTIIAQNVAYAPQGPVTSTGY